MKLLSKNIEEKKEKRYNIHGLSCIDSFPEANRRGGGAVPFFRSADHGSPYTLTWRNL
jgi:hypothetical protein